jgi:methionyl aminopeptidase
MDILNEEEREMMRIAGRFNAQLMDEVRKIIAVGVSLNDINDFVHSYTLEHGHTPATLNYGGFPKSCCVSVNDVVCHGIPNEYALQDGDIVNVDLTTIVDGWHGDSSETFLVGNVRKSVKRLVQCAFDSLYKGIEAIKPGGKVRDIGQAIVWFANHQRLSVVQELMGHGIGKEFHQKPHIPHFPHPELGKIIIEPGMCFTIEPMINAGKKEVYVDPQDKWTVRTKDGRRSAQFEHTILMTEDGPEILTLTKDGPQKGYQFNE